MDLVNELQKEGILAAEMAASASKQIASGMSLEQSLLSAGVARDVVRERLAKFYGIPAYVPAEGETVSQKVLEYIPAEAAKNYNIVPLKVEEDTLLIGVNDPEDFRLREVLNFVSTKHGLPYKYVFLLSDDLGKFLRGYENLTGEVGEALTTLETELNDEIAFRKEQDDDDVQRLAAEHIKEDAPVTKLVATI